MTAKRIAWFDNCKGILIFLVVFGHSIESYRSYSENTIVLWLYNTIYAFHMPLFILISGYFFREGKLKRIVQFMGVFLIWQIINGFLQPLITSGALPDFGADGRIYKLLIPYWTLWYLIGMIVWLSITPYFLKLRYPIVFAVILAIWVSFVPDVTSWLSFRKVINFYPFFLIGYTLGQKGAVKLLQEKIHTHGRLIRSSAVILILFFLAFMAYFTKANFSTAWLYMSLSYKNFGLSWYKGALFSIFYYGGITCICLAILSLIPTDTKLFLFNKMGVHSLYIYLLHVNLILLFRVFVPNGITHHPMTLLPLAFLVALLIGLIASSGPIIRSLRPIIEPRFNKLLVQAGEKNRAVSKPSGAKRATTL